MKNKKTLSISILSALFVGLSTSSFVLGLSSCATSPSNVSIPATNASSFSSLNISILPVSSAVLSTEKGRQSLVSTYVNKTLLNWFNVVNNSSIQNSLKDWKKTAEDSYKEKYNNYKDTRGVNWKHFFQIEVLDPVGGTKEDWILNNIKSELKTFITTNLFGDSAKNYLSYSNNSTSTNPSFISVDNLNLQTLKDINNDYVNATTVGTKNGFSFNALGLEENNRSQIDIGYADLLEFIMDDWIKNCLPLPLTMSLWKNYENTYNLSQLFSNYFDRFNQTTSGDSSSDTSTDTSTSTRAISRATTTEVKPSYQFQYFSDETSPVALSSTDKFSKLLTGIINGSYVSSKTGLMNLPLEYTEDSSTNLLTNSSGLFDGTYVTPFSAAAWYKFSNFIFGITDSNVHVATSINTKSIMDNFLVFNNNASSSEHLNIVNDTNSNVLNYFKFPYSIDWENGSSQNIQSVFLNQYSNAVGVIDAINFTKQTSIFNDSNTYANSNLDQFILIRNQFGVHIISIDRISKIKEAYESNTNKTFSQRFNNVCNELRNTFIYYLALDKISNEGKYNVKDMMQKYFSDNFESIIYRYLLRYIDSPTNNQNNLFGASVTLNSEQSPNLSSNFGYDSTNEDQSNFINSLNEIISTTSLRSFIDSSIDYQYAVLSKKFVESINNKIYENQSQFNNNEDPSLWGANGISGVLPYTRNSNNGQFETLTKLIDSILMNVTPSSSNLPYSNNTNDSRAISGTISNVTVTDTSSYFYQAKNNYQQNVIKYLNETNPLIINSTYNFLSSPTRIFTSNYYLNQAMIALGDTDFSNIVRNMYYQQYLYPNRRFMQNLPTNPAEGTTEWIVQKVSNAIDSVYKMNLFVDSKNVYSLGDWDSYDALKAKANQFFSNSIDENQFTYSYADQDGNNIEYYSYSQYSEIEEYYNLLINIRYVLDYNTETSKLNFKPLYDALLQATDNGTSLNPSRSAVAWVNQESINQFKEFGYSSSNLSSQLTITNLQTKAISDSTFKINPVLLTNINSYSWFNSTNPYPNFVSSGSLVDSTNQNSLTFSKDNSYWTVAPMSNTSSTSNYNSGFLGFQLENSSPLGISSSLPTSWTSNSSYSNLPVSQTNVSYIGMFYSFVSRSNLINLIDNVTTPSQLQSFYENQIANSGLPISQQNHTAMENIINTAYSTITEKLDALKTKLKEILNDTTQVPNNAFTKLDQMPLWNNELNSFTTLFDTNSQTAALKNQYVLTQFNNNDVKNLLNSNSELTTGSKGYLGLNPDTFFTALVMFCRDSTSLKNKAIDEMYKTVGSIQIYDIRLLYIIPRLYVSNFEQWSEIEKIS